MSTRAHPIRRILRILGLGILTALVLLFAFIGVLTIVRDAPDASVRAFGDHSGPPSVADPQFESSLAVLTGAQFSAANRVDLLVSGNATYPALWSAMHAAQHSITAQLYYMLPGHLCDSLVAVLSERARAGVQTYLLHDAIGSTLPDSTMARLTAAGVHVATFRPVKWWTLHKAQNRSHVRAVVIDGVTGFTGGFGIDDRWDGDGRHDQQWRDTNVRVRGPAVRQLQAVFDGAWTEATGQMLVGDIFFPAAGVHDSAAIDTHALVVPSSGGSAANREQDSGVEAALLHSSPTFGPTANVRLLALAIAGARHTLFISNAYFVPDRSMLDNLRSAARRGVDVRILLPGEKTDVPMTRFAARSWYALLIRSGVKVYEYQPSMLHAKTFVADGMLGSVGSMNLDYRSLAMNDEVNLLVVDPTFGARMDSLYMEDLRYARPIDLAQFERRGMWDRIRERFARAIGRAL